jgi:hypothetical protein
MASIRFSYQCKKPKTETSERLTKALKEDHNIRKLDPNIEFTVPDSSGFLEVTGSQFKARVHLKGDDKSSELAFAIEIPFILLPFKSKIEESVKRTLDRHLA